jgi:hypothetical protein
MDRVDDPNAKAESPSANARDAATPARAAADVVFVHGPTPTGVQITRLRDERIETGELRPIKEGQSVLGELVKLSPRADNERLFDVEVLAKSPFAASATASAKSSEAAPAGARKGPPKVATERFRANWDDIFASRKKGELPS